MTLKLNEVGDVVLDNADLIRALADPERLHIFEALQRSGPATVSSLATSLGLDDRRVLAGLTEMAATGLVSADGEHWQAFGRGLFLQAPEDDPEVLAAIRALGNVMILDAAGLPGKWVSETEPALEPSWAAAAGMFNARVALTPDELDDIQAELERVLEPYTNREQTPADARRVRVLAFFMPESAE